MRWLISSSRWSLAVVGILALLLAVLATLQYRWIAQLSEAERARLKEGLDQAAAGYCEDFDREIARAYSVFTFNRVNDERELSHELADRLAEWRSVAEWPELVGELFIIRVQEPNEVVLLCFDEESQTLHQCAWQEELLPIRRHLDASGPGVPVIDGALPGLVLAIEEQVVPDARPQHWRPPRDHLVVRFDLDFIAETLLPSLGETHFAVKGGQPYLLSVSSEDRPGEAVFQSASHPPLREVDADATHVLFALRSFPEFSLFSGGQPRDRRPPPPGRAREPGGPPPQPNLPPPGLHARTEEGHWVLAVRHPGGSLELVVSKTRRRNMAISLAILVMLGITAALMVVSTRSARRLARQQMDFVAAVSHELRTPLTAIRSAGQNLAEGIIDDPEKIRSYGQLIEREGRRLTDMIGRVLTFAGIRSGRQIYRMEAVDVTDIVATVLEDSAWVLEENSFEVDTKYAGNLPHVIGDPAAFRQVISNLIDNAVKYASSGGWLGVRVDFEPTPANGEVRISISDHGPGIPKRELSSVFEPFGRGKDAAGSSTPGNGLGLAVARSIVEAHNGNIDVGPLPGGGTTFTVRLPVVPEPNAEKRGRR